MRRGDHESLLMMRGTWKQDCPSGPRLVLRRPTCSAPLTNARAEAGLEEGVRCHSRFLPSPLCLPASCCDVHNRCVCRVGTPSPPCRIICGFTRRGTHNQSVGANFRTARASFLTINQSVCGRAWLSVLRALEEHDTLTHVPNGIPYGARVHRGGRSPPRPPPPSPSPPRIPLAKGWAATIRAKGQCSQGAPR